MHPGTAGRTRVALSTGHEIDLPLELEFAMGGVTVPARRDRLEALLPDGLSALAVAPGLSCVTFVGIRYHRVGGRFDDTEGDGALEPYDEFAVIVPAVRNGRTDAPIAQLAGGEVGGYVHWLPVTTDASVALGREIWGYPKERADIEIDDGSQRFQCVVAEDSDDGRGRERVRLAVAPPRTRVGTDHRERTLWSYTTKDGDLLRTRAEIWGEIALGTPIGATLEVDPELRAELGCRPRPIARLSGSRVRARLHPGEPVGDV
ncbi:acetoacetate decarboxylase family protein [Haloterrigena sp. SYSU A558-1]|uniref:Acetoacetate decarboxylase family protein n=1 Tax=Haloterrigena gelatinilytica TaxID=2741724 RepID=A0ABX2LL81_9EURY|nr:acetoacetate decarboxylase family protein [Haloterrigena gelatinilytica]NUC74556.1 acetoacetate decarboxylase family protein [Haloterrigena gelatinilytica]